MDRLPSSGDANDFSDAKVFIYFCSAPPRFEKGKIFHPKLLFVAAGAGAELPSVDPRPSTKLHGVLRNSLAN